MSVRHHLVRNHEKGVGRPRSLDGLRRRHHIAHRVPKDGTPGEGRVGELPESVCHQGTCKGLLDTGKEPVDQGRRNFVPNLDVVEPQDLLQPAPDERRGPELAPDGSPTE